MARFDVKVELNNAGVHSSGIKIKQYSYGIDTLRFLFFRGGSAFNPCEEFEKISLRILRADGKSDEITVYDGNAGEGFAIDDSGTSYFEHKINYFDSFVPGVVSYEIFFYSVADGGVDGVAVSPRINLEVYKSISSFNIVDKKSMDFFAHLLDEIKALQATVTYEQYIAKLGEISDFLKNVENGAQVNVQADWSENDEISDSYIKNKPVVDQTLDIGSDNAIANWIVASQFDAMGEAFRITEGAVEKVKDGLAEAKILAGNLQTEADKHRNNEDVDIKHLTDSEKADVAKIAKIEADVEELQLGKADVDVVGNLASSVEMVKSELTNAKTDIGEINTQMDGLQMGVDSNTLDIAGIRTDIAILEADKINRKELQDALYPPTVTDVPATLAVNTAYNFGSQANITLAFPTVANDGDVIYVGFVSRDTTNLIVDTTNTFDFELIPEVNTGYEIYARCTTNEGEVRWIVKYSEYTGVTQ